MGHHTLILRVKEKYFKEIRFGIKKEEFRLVTPYWISRIEKRAKDLRGISIILGYPSVQTPDNTMNFPWNGYDVREIVHEEFGKEPVKVFAIKLEGMYPYVR